MPHMWLPWLKGSDSSPASVSQNVRYVNTCRWRRRHPGSCLMESLYVYSTWWQIYIKRNVQRKYILPIPQLHYTIMPVSTQFSLFTTNSNCTIIHGDQYQVDSSQTTINVDSFNVKTTLQDGQPCPLGKVNFCCFPQALKSLVIVSVDSPHTAPCRLS